MSEIGDQISLYQRILLLSPRSHSLRSSHLQLLASLYYNRHAQSDQKADLDMSILSSTEAIFVASHSNRVDEDTVQGFYLLAVGLINRLQLFNQPTDAQHCLEYFRYLESQPLEAFGIPSDKVKINLLVALASQVELGIGNAARNIDEMMVRCRDLLAFNIPQPFLKPAITALVRADEANRRLGSHDPYVAMQLALLLSHRFRDMYSMDDYEGAMAIYDKIITSEPNIDCPGPHAASALFFSAILAAERARIYGTPEYLEEAIYCHRKFLKIPSTDDFHHSMVARALANLTRERSSYLRITGEGLPDAHSPDLKATSFPHLVATLRAGSTIDKTNWWAVPEDREKYLRPLQTVCHTTDLPEIEEAIEYCRLLLALTPPSDSIIYYPAKALGDVLYHAFECTGNIEYLNNSIAAFRNILGMPIAEWAHFQIIVVLHEALSVHWNRSEDKDDIDEMMQLCSMATKDTHANIPDRLRFSYVWAESARRHGHHTTSTAYETALSLMEETLLLAPTLETQHFHLVSRRDIYEALPKDMASYEVSRGRLQNAIQALERGRALIWSQMRGFRTSIDQPAIASHLAEEFAAVSQELETLTTSVSPDTAMPRNGHEDDKAMDTFGRLVVRHRELSAKRKELVSQIQALPGLKGFLKTPPFDTLRSAALRGPVIIVNHSEWRCDIMIILHHTRPSLITTPNDFYDRAIELRDLLVRAQNNSMLESRQYQRALRFVLKNLYELVGRPVIEELQRLNIPKQSRIWWCPTSVFCSLPLHAMGPVPSDDGVPRYFSDLYIPSYTPTLSALIASHKPSKSSFAKPSVLLMANLDDSLKQAWPEIRSVQRLDTVTRVTALLGKRATASAVLEGLQNHQFSHFICHGQLILEKPFDASFGLYGGERLTLLDIVRSRLPNAEFAFLSACHTAGLTEGSIADEGLHLTAAAQYCGFRSVVGTLWAMADKDGGDLAKHFYKSMFSSDEPGVPYHERAARALRDAVRYIRKEKQLPLEQWVNFVHYGA